MKIAILIVAGLAFLTFLYWFVPGRSPSAIIDPQALQAHLERYSSFGHHRSGGPGDQATRDWLSEELRLAGFEVEIQTVPIRQWHHDAAFIQTPDAQIDGFPLWWPPETEAARSAHGPIKPIQEAALGDIGLLRIDPHLLSSLRAEHISAIQESHARGVAGVILLTETISGEPFAFNAWSNRSPVPVLILGSEHDAALTSLLESGSKVELAIAGNYEDAETSNVIGRLERSGDQTVTVSTPRTGWFNAGAERGPGIALFIELAKWAAGEGDADLVFVATGGHEIAHVGMTLFMESGAPDPDKTANWVHLGASIAAFDRSDRAGGHKSDSAHQNTKTRWVIYTGNMTLRVFKLFRGLGYQHSPAYISVFGEAKDIHEAGYDRFIAFAGSHPNFHLPSDTAVNTSGEILAPTGLAVQKVMLGNL